MIKIGLTLRENILFNENIHTNPCHRFTAYSLNLIHIFGVSFGIRTGAISPPAWKQLSINLPPSRQKDLRVKLGGRNNSSIQRNSRSINLFSIQECIFGIHRIQGKLRSIVWTVYSILFTHEMGES
jgi:hypothetical protein